MDDMEEQQMEEQQMEEQPEQLEQSEAQVEKTDQEEKGGESPVISKDDFLKAQKEKKPEEKNEGEADASGDEAQEEQPKKKRGVGRPKKKPQPIKLKMPTIQKMQDPYKNLMVLQLHFKGMSDGVSASEDRLMARIYRLSKDQRNKLQKIKVDVYRIFRRLSSFKVEGKFVVPRKSLPELEAAFAGCETDFKELREDLYKDLRTNWADIVKDLETKYKTLPVDFNDVAKMEPDSPTFLKMDYVINPLESLLNDMEGLKNVFMNGEIKSEEIAKRVEAQKDDLIKEIHVQYEKKLEQLTENVEKLKKAAKKNAKGSYIEKLQVKAEKNIDDLSEMASILGEDDALKTMIDGMQEALLMQSDA